MTDAESRLADFWHASEAPARDLVFELGVEQAIARRRMMIDLGAICAGGLAAGLALLVLGSGLFSSAHALLLSFDAVGPVLAAAAGIVGALIWLNQEPDEA